MNKKIIIILLSFSIAMFSSRSYADWKKVSAGMDGTNFYVDFERMRQHGGYVYWWVLQDQLKPDENGQFSSKNYRQGDCKLFRFKYLSFSIHKEPMGDGTGKVIEPSGDHAKWRYPIPDTVNEQILKTICSR